MKRNLASQTGPWHPASPSNPPHPLPWPLALLQVLLSQVHRLRALVLLGRFLDMGAWAVDLALSGRACLLLVFVATGPSLPRPLSLGPSLPLYLPLELCAGQVLAVQQGMHAALASLTTAAPCGAFFLALLQWASSPTSSSCCRPRPATCARRWSSSGPRSWHGTPTRRWGCGGGVAGGWRVGRRAGGQGLREREVQAVVHWVDTPFCSRMPCALVVFVPRTTLSTPNPPSFLPPWFEILQVQSDLTKDGGHSYFVKHLESRDPAVSPESRAQAAFVLAAICSGNPKGQLLCAQAGLMQVGRRGAQVAGAAVCCGMQQKWRREGDRAGLRMEGRGL